jgi:hypothetical protein
MMRKFCSALLVLMLPVLLPAQELNARVTVLYNQISTTVDRRVFQTLQTQLQDLLNKRKWTSEDYSIQEKVRCSFLLNLTSNVEANTYKATLTVQAARPVFNSSYQAAIMNHQDNDVVFRYQEFQPIEFNENRVQGTDPLASNLTAIFAYYVYMILGIDHDSFAPRGGDPYFQKANAIVNAAPDGRLITGWRPFDSQRNRYWLAENMLNSRYALIHDAYYAYYRNCLDHLYEDDNIARQELMNSLNLLYTLKDDSPNIMAFQFFFQGKSDEIINILKMASPSERSRAVEILQKIDPTNLQRYKEELK